MDGSPVRNNDAGRYGSSLILLHWLMLLLFMAAYVTIEGSEWFPEHGTTHEMLMVWHYQIGYAILALTGIRILCRLTGSVPHHARQLSTWQHRLARLVHILLYGLMLLLPLSGWLMLSSAGHSSQFLGLEMPMPLARNGQTAELLEEFHEFLGLAGYFLIGLHTLAALFHHYFLQDNSLRNMLPGKRLESH